MAQGSVFYNSNPQWGESYSILVGFSEEDAEALTQIAALVMENPAIDPDAYDMKPLFNEESSSEYWLKLKVSKKDPSKFDFKCNLPLVANPEKTDVRGMSKGQAVTIRCEAFAWYNSKEGKCGLGFKLLELEFEKPARAARPSVATGRKATPNDDGEQ
jgi:hypothetical protein